MEYDISKYKDMSPHEIRLRIRRNEFNLPTSGMCLGYAQANLVILPRRYAVDFLEYARKNPFPCPVLEVIQGSPKTHGIAEDGDITTDISEYYVYRDGKRCEILSDVSQFWQDDSVGFLLGCSFSFEEALLKAGIEIRHLTQKRIVPMFKTNIATVPAGPFSGPMVCTMRPMTPENAKKACEITKAYPNVHGAPVNIGEPEKLGIKDIMHPDWGDGVDIYPGEVPVFWPCGVTPQAAIENARLPLVLTHSPSHMFITDIKNTELNAYIDRVKADFKVL